MKNRFWTLALMMAVAIAAGSGAVVAMPSLGGPTGIVSVPNALVAPTGQLQTALTYQSQTYASSMYGDNVDATYWALNVLTGVTDEAELWAAYALVDQDMPTGSETANMWAIGGKYQFTKEPEDQASLAVGGSWESWSDSVLAGGGSMYGTGDFDVFKAYIVATKDFTPMTGQAWEWSEGGVRMLGSVGLMYTKLSPDQGDSMSMSRPFVGLEFLSAKATALGLEYRWKDDDIDMKSVFSAVLRYRFSPVIEAEIGTTNAGPAGIGLDDQDFFVRVGYTIPMGGY
jgi:hypothetical protein